jgi:hypothetical protein
MNRAHWIDRVLDRLQIPDGVFVVAAVLVLSVVLLWPALLWLLRFFW